MNIAERLRFLMAEQNLSVYALAKASGLPWSTVNNLFVRQTIPNVATLSKLCNGLGISLVQFFDVDNTSGHLSTTHQYLLQRFDALSDKNKHIILTTLRIL